MPLSDWMYSPDVRVETALADFFARRRTSAPTSLDSVKVALQVLGNPQNNLPPVFHVAGTNGKGSVLAFVQAIFEAANMSAHKFTSPHLARFEERVLVSGTQITPDTLYHYIQKLQVTLPDIPSLRFFESVACLALMAFADHQADVCLLETGCGGRVDAVNTVPAHVVMITPVSLDHMHILGDTEEKIAHEKAGIIKSPTPVIVSAQRDDVLSVIEKRAHDMSAPLYREGVEWRVEKTSQGFIYESARSQFVLPFPALAGDYQLSNAGVAIAAVEQSDFSSFATEATLTQAMHTVVWPARLQRLVSGPLVDLLPERWELWLDGAHNQAGVQVLAGQAQNWAKDKDIHLITAMKGSKSAGEFYAPLQPYVQKAVVPDAGFLNAPMAPPAQVIASLVLAGYQDLSQAASLCDAIKTLTFQNSSPARILIAGSLYLAGYVLREHS